MILLADAYEKLDRLLKDRGLVNESYNITVTTWNRRNGEPPDIKFTASVMAGPSGITMAYERATLEEAVAELDRLVAEWQAPTPAPITDLRMDEPSGHPVSTPAGDDSF